jgi:GMP synthase-like glutamine amidotransferase
MHVTVLTHAKEETAGAIAPALRAKKLSLRVVKGYAGQPVPNELAGARGLVVMGGPMGVRDASRFPFLRDEMRLIERALRAEIPVLGVCLGSQLVASVLGAHVSKAPAREIGWLPVELAPSAGRDPIFSGVRSPLLPCHWHGDVFTLPAGAVSLARSARTRCQAFRYARAAYGVLFHMELSRAGVARMCATFADELAEAGITRREMLDAADKCLPRLEPVARGIFGRWAEECLRER